MKVYQINHEMTMEALIAAPCFTLSFKHERKTVVAKATHCLVCLLGPPGVHAGQQTDAGRVLLSFLPA